MRKTKVQNRSTKGDGITAAIPRACADELAAVEFLEAQRWGGQPACPRCGSEAVQQLMGRDGKRQADFRWACRDCRKAKAKWQFTVRIGTVFEDSRVPLRHWCYAFWRAATSKKGVSALEIKRQTGLSYKSALFLLNRIRFAMADSAPGLLGPKSGIVEADETFVGGKVRRYSLADMGAKRRFRSQPKPIVAAAVERGGSVKTKIIPRLTAENLRPFLLANVDKSARLMTDEYVGYRRLGKEFASHQTVQHVRLEYARGDVTTNTIEGFFSIVKRGLNGIYHAVSKEHLHRYLAEFEFRYNNRELEDGARIAKAVRASEGKRLMYRQPVVE
jgi:transposase-like protein